MKIDHDYLKGLLEAFEASDEPQTDIKALLSMDIIMTLMFFYSTCDFLKIGD